MIDYVDPYPLMEIGIKLMTHYERNIDEKIWLTLYKKYLSEAYAVNPSDFDEKNKIKEDSKKNYYSEKDFENYFEFLEFETVE